MPENILITAAEIRGMRKFGGLGDFTESYAKALTRHYGYSPTVTVPTPLNFPISGPLTILTIDNKKIPVYSLSLNGLDVLALGSPKTEGDLVNISVYYSRRGLCPLQTYGSYWITKEEAQNSGLFARSVAKMIEQGIVKPNIVDAQDWVSAALIVLLRKNANKDLERIATIYGSHNELYRGTLCSETKRIDSWKGFVEAFGLKQSVKDQDSPDFITPQFQQGCRYPFPAFSIGKGAMNLADAAYIVGEHYAQESEQAYGRHIQGIQNGLDPNAKFDLLGVQPGSDINAMLQAKAEAKRTLQERLKLNVDPHAKLLVWLHRDADEKQPDALNYLVSNMGDLKIQIIARKVLSKQPYDRTMCSIEDVFEDDKFTTPAFRAADGVLSCSITEPWGFTIAQGIAALAVPIVSPAAGHMDLVTQYDGEDGIGFMAKTFSQDDLMNAVIEFARAAENPQHLKRLIENLNKIDLTWERGPLLKHLGLYEEAKNARDRRIAK